MARQDKGRRKRNLTAVPRQEQGIRGRSNPWLYPLIVTGAFFLVVLFGLVHHEMWRDEHQAWLVARDAGSLAGLFENLRYEGNPALWHLCLYAITGLSSNPVWMQALHLLIACGFVYVFNRYCPLGIALKLLFTFGYFPAYEYAVISRGYGLGLLLTFGACALYKNRSSHYLALFLILGLLANVSLYGVIVSLGLAGSLALDQFWYRDKAQKLSPALLAGFGLYLLLAVAAMCQIIPNKDNSFPVHTASGWFDSPRWAYVLSRLFTTYFYLPNPSGMHFWNTNVFFPEPMKIANPPDVWHWMTINPLMILVFAILPVAAFLVCLVMFLRKPLILLLYAGLTAALLLVYYYTLLVHMRYCGHLLVVLLVCVWLAKYYPDHAFRNRLLGRLASDGKTLQKPLLTFILVVQVLGTLVAYAKDYEFKFSVSKEVANYIRENDLDRLEFAGMTDFVLSPLSSYFNKKIFYLERLEFGSFTRWDKKRRDNLSPREVFEAIGAALRAGQTKVLFITSEPMLLSEDGQSSKPVDHLLLTSDTKVDLLRAFEAGIVGDEKYNLYLIQKVDPSKEDLTGYAELHFK